MIYLLSTCALVLTVARSWPQFFRIIVENKRSGVSAVTWMLALANHVGWLMYGVLSPVPLFVVVNLLAGAGCAAITCVLESWVFAAGVIVITAVFSFTVFAAADVALLVLINGLSCGMFVPQLIKVLRSGSEGVSLTTWVLAAMASTTWIGYAFAIGRPAVVAAHFLMLPSSVLIVSRVLMASRRR